MHESNRKQCLPKDKGGLGIKDLKTFNTALLGKWRQDLFHQHGESWARILDSKYGGWRTLEEGTRGSHESSWWKDLLITHQQQLNNALKKETTWRVGRGDKFRFWEDCWIGNDTPLMVKYPRLYQDFMPTTANHYADGEQHKRRMGMEVQLEETFI